MKFRLLVACLLLALPADAGAQSALAGTDLRLVPLTTAPSNLSGRAGIWNHSGVYTWHSASDADGPILQCPGCSTNVLPYFDTLSGNSALPSNFYYNSTSKQFCDGSSGGVMCIRLDDIGGAADIGYHLGFGDGNYVQNDTVGTKIFHNGANFAQSVGTGASEEWQVKGKIESTTGGYVFPDHTVQTTAAATGGIPANYLIFDPTRYAIFNNTNCTGGFTHPFYAHTQAGDRNIASAGIFTMAVHVTGVHFYYGGTGSGTATLALWINAGPPTMVTSCTVAYSGPGLYACSWTPVAEPKGSPMYFSAYTPGEFTQLEQCDNGFGPVPQFPSNFSNAIEGAAALIWEAWGRTSGDDNGNIAPTQNLSAVTTPVAVDFTVP